MRTLVGPQRRQELVVLGHVLVAPAQLRRVERRQRRLQHRCAAVSRPRSIDRPTLELLQRDVVERQLGAGAVRHGALRGLVLHFLTTGDATRIPHPMLQRPVAVLPQSLPTYPSLQKHFECVASASHREKQKASAC